MRVLSALPICLWVGLAAAQHPFRRLAAQVAGDSEGERELQPSGPGGFGGYFVKTTEEDYPGEEKNERRPRDVEWRGTGSKRLPCAGMDMATLVANDYVVQVEPKCNLTCMNNVAARLEVGAPAAR
jgi:hypothetical protein